MTLAKGDKQHDLNILIGAKLSNLTVGILNAQLRRIEKQIKPIELQVRLSKQFGDTLKQLNQAINNAIKINNDFNRVIKEEVQIIKGLDGVSRRVTKQRLQDGTIITKEMEVIDEKNKKLKQQKIAIEDMVRSEQRLAVQRTKFNGQGKVAGYKETYNDGKTKETFNLDSNRNVISSEDVKQVEQLAQAQDKLNKRYEDLRKVGRLSAQQFKDLKKVLREATDFDGVEKATQQLAKYRDIQKENLRIEKLGEKKTTLKPSDLRDTELVKKRIAQQYGIADEDINKFVKLQKTVDQAGKTLYKFNVDHVKKGASDFTRYSGTVDVATKSMYQFDQQTKKALNRDLGFFEQFKIAMTRIPVWMAAMTLFYAPLHALQSMVTTIIEVDTQMTELKRVMDEDTNFDDMLEGSIRLATELGQKVQDVNKAMIGFARQGFEGDGLLDMTKTAVLAGNISDLSVDEAMEDITSAMISFNIEAEDSIRIVDSLNEVDNKFAVTTQQLANSIRKSGSTAQAYGVTLEEMIGHTTAIGVATRESGEVIGNSLKTIYSRLTSDDSLKALQAVNIEVRNLDGTTRSATEILADLASAWENLNNTTQQNLAVTIAGRYQLNKFQALMANFKTGIDATNTALNSQGSAMKENEKYLQSLQANINKLKAAWVELSLATGESGLAYAMLLVIKLATTLTSGFAELTKATGGLNFALPLIGATIAGFIVSGKSLITILTAMRTAVIGFTTTFVASMRSVKVAMGVVGLAIIGLELAVSGVLGSTSKASEMEDFSNKTAESFQKASKTSLEHADKLQTLLTQYDELSARAKGNALAQSEVTRVMKEMKQVAPALTTALDNQGTTFEEKSKSVQQYIDSLKKLSEQQIAQAKITNKTKMLNVDSEINNVRQQIEKLQPKILEAQEQLNQLMKKYGASTVEELRLIIDQQLEAIANGVKGSTGKLRYDLGLIQRYSEGRTDAFSFGNNSADYADATDKLDKLEEQKKQLRDLENALNGVGGASKQTKTAIEQLGDAVNDTGDETETTADYFSNLQEKYGLVKGEMDELNQVNQDLIEGNEISADTAVNLMMKHRDLIGVFTLENGVVKVNQQAFSLYRQSRINDYNQIIEATNIEAQNTAKATVAKLNSYGIEVKAIQNLADAKNALAKIDEKMSQAFELSHNLEWLRLNEEKIKVEDIKKQYEAIEMLKMMAGAGLSSVGVSDKEKSKERAVEAHQIDLYRIAVEELETRIKISETVMERYAETSAEYRKELELQIDLQKQLQNLAHNEAVRLDARNKNLRSQINALGNFNNLSNDQRDIYNDLQSELEDNIGTMKQLSQTWWDLQKQIEEENFQKIISEADSFNDKLDDIDYVLGILPVKMAQLSENSKEYTKQLMLQKALLLEKQQLIHDEAEFIKKELETNQNLTDKYRKELEERREELSGSWWDIQGQIDAIEKGALDKTKDIADQVVDAYKKAYERQKQLALEAIDAELKALDESHKQKIEYLDEELSKYDEIINAKIKALDDQANEEDYNKELTKAQKEEQDLVNKINVLSLDNSREAQARRNALEQQLAEKRQEIADMQTEHQRENEKKDLEDRLDNYKKDVEEKKNAENDKYDVEKKRLEDLRKLREWEYDEMINDEQKFAKIREDIIKGNIDNIQKELQGFVDEFTKINVQSAKEIGIGFNQLLEQIKNIKNLADSLNILPSPSAMSKEQAISMMKENAANWSNVSTDAERNALHIMNQDIAKKFGFIYDQVSGAWYDKDGKTRLFHNGGTVGDKASRIGGIVDKLFNTKPNEQVVKAMQGELFVPDQNIAQNFLPNMRKLLSSITLPQIAVGASGDSGTRIDNLQLVVNLKSGTKKDGELVAEGFIDILKKKGVL